MKKLLIGLGVGICAGIIDVTPMIVQGLSIDADLSAFAMWVVVGYLIAFSSLQVHPLFKGLLVAIPTIIPVAILIGFKEPFTLIPIGVMTLILGALSGLLIEKLLGKTA